MNRSTHREVSSCSRVVELPEIVRHEAPGLAAVCSPEAFAQLSTLQQRRERLRTPDGRWEQPDRWDRPTPSTPLASLVNRTSVCVRPVTPGAVPPAGPSAADPAATAGGVQCRGDRADA